MLPWSDRKDSDARNRSHVSNPSQHVIVLTADPTLLATLREASAFAPQLLQASSSQAAVDLLSSGQGGMVIIDVALIGEGIVTLVEQLQAQFPRALLLATGHRAEQQAVAGLIGSGRIYRFLHKPISPGRAEAFLSSAARRYAELNSRTPRTRLPATLASPSLHMVAVAVLLLALLGGGLAWWSTRDRDSSPVATEPEPAATETPSDPSARTPTLVPRGNRAAPAPSARAAQPTPVTPPPTAASAERAAAPRVETPNVDLARAFLAANQLADPADASALSSLRTAREAGEDANAIQAVAIDLGGRFLSQALAALEENDLSRARRAYELASIVDRELEVAIPNLDELAARIEATEAASQRARVAALVERATQLRRSGQLIEPAGDNAIDALQAARALDAADAGVQAERRQLALTLLEHARTALAAGDIDRADILVMRAEEVLPELPQSRAVREQIGAARAQREENTVLQAASLPRTREVPAVYPRDALLNGIEGWVDLEFTISPTGVPTDIRIKNSSRARTFDTAAVQALRQWRFEPIVQNGEPRARRAVLRINFRLKP